jgi:hypothetical protein
MKLRREGHLPRFVGAGGDLADDGGRNDANDHHDDQQLDERKTV